MLTLMDRFPFLVFDCHIMPVLRKRECSLPGMPKIDGNFTTANSRRGYTGLSVNGFRMCVLPLMESTVFNPSQNSVMIMCVFISVPYTSFPGTFNVCRLLRGIWGVILAWASRSLGLTTDWEWHKYYVILMNSHSLSKSGIPSYK